MITTATRTVDAWESEELLAHSARQGSGTAFLALAMSHRDAVYVIARNMSRSLRETEDAIRQTYLVAWRDFGRFPQGARFSTWLYGIAMTTLLCRGHRDGRATSFSAGAFLREVGAEGRLGDGGAEWGDGLERISISPVLREDVVTFE